jgi:hypothetical protein
MGQPSRCCEIGHGATVAGETSGMPVRALAEPRHQFLIVTVVTIRKHAPPRRHGHPAGLRLLRVVTEKDSPADSETLSPSPLGS